MKKLKNEQKEQQKRQTLDYGTNIDSINVKKSNVAINGVVLVEERFQELKLQIKRPQQNGSRT